MGFWYKPICDGNCLHYGSFGDIEGCGQKNGECELEPIEPGQKCFYPKKRDVRQSIKFIISSVGFCAALEGAVIKGGSHDNTQLVRILTGSENEKAQR